MTRLEGRTALITGASSGIGAHLARVLAGHGAKVVLAARRIGRVQALAADLAANGAKAFPVALDVTDEASVVAAFNSAEKHFGRVDTIIANAGVAVAGRATDLAARDVASVLDTNLLGVYLTVREGARRLIAAGSRDSENGRVIVIGSITADLTGQSDAAYAASKAGVRHLARQFAREWARMGINVNVIQPGYIKTELAGDWFDTSGGAQHVQSFHRKRLIPLEALDELTILLSSSASKFITGATFTIDDGQSL